MDEMNIKMECNGLTKEEKELITKAISEIQKKRKNVGKEIRFIISWDEGRRLFSDKQEEIREQRHERGKKKKSIRNINKDVFKRRIEMCKRWLENLCRRLPEPTNGSVIVRKRSRRHRHGNR